MSKLYLELYPKFMISGVDFAATPSDLWHCPWTLLGLRQPQTLCQYVPFFILTCWHLVLESHCESITPVLETLELGFFSPGKC